MDLDNMSDAELGAMVRKQMKAALGANIEAAKPIVEEQRIQHEAEQVAAIAAEQEVRPGRLYEGFVWGSLEVPTLDVTNVSTLDEIPSAKVRSPYNKALYRMGETLLTRDDTYGTLVALHQRLAAMPVPGAKTKNKAKVETPKVDTVQTPVEVVLAVTDVDSLATSMADLFEISLDEAKQRLASY